jgi:toxin ParE1/3/4
MRYRLIVREEAEADITQAAQWYENERLGLGIEFISEIRRVVRNAKANPFLYPVISRHPAVHRALTNRFPYRVFFIVRRNAVIVFAVLHAKRSDHAWQQRT